MSLSGPDRPYRACCVKCYHHSRGATRRTQRETERFRLAACPAGLAWVQRRRPWRLRGWITSASAASSRSITRRATSERSRL